jgi:TatD DNase family protein
MIFCDSHTHLYVEEFRDDVGEVIQRAVSAGVEHLFLPNVDEETFDPMMKLADAYPSICFPMAGLHPTSVKNNFRAELDFMERCLERHGERLVAIGEIGIDLYWDRSFEKEQRQTFSFQLDLALKYDLPAVIHTRNSMDIALEMIRERKEPGLRGVFHCFSGNIAQAQQAVGLGFYLGIGGVITYRNSGLQSVVEVIPPDHLLLETDSPWLPPVPHRGERNEPSFISLIAAKVAEIKNLSIEEVASITTKNTLNLFGLSTATNDQMT